MAVFTPPFVLPVMAAISSRESPVARNCSNRLVPAGSRSSALSAILSASDCSNSEEASLPSESHSGYTPLLTGPFLRQSEMQLFFVVDTAQASALRICTPSRLATQSRSSTSCTTSSGSPSSRDARKNFSAVARTLGLISVSSISSVLSILHRHRRKNRKKSSKFSNFFSCPPLSTLSTPSTGGQSGRKGLGRCRWSGPMVPCSGGSANAEVDKGSGTCSSVSLVLRDAAPQTARPATFIATLRCKTVSEQVCHRLADAPTLH